MVNLQQAKGGEGRRDYEDSVEGSKVFGVGEVAMHIIKASNILI